MLNVMRALCSDRLGDRRIEQNLQPHTDTFSKQQHEREGVGGGGGGQSERVRERKRERETRERQRETERDRERGREREREREEMDRMFRTTSKIKTDTSDNLLFHHNYLRVYVHQF